MVSKFLQATYHLDREGVLPEEGLVVHLIKIGSGGTALGQGELRWVRLGFRFSGQGELRWVRLGFRFSD